MKEQDLEKILILNLYTIPFTGLDTYAKMWKNIYGKNSQYINMYELEQFQKENYWMLFFNFLLGREKKYISYIENKVKEENIDIIHLAGDTIFSSYLLNIIEKKLNIKIIYTLHDPVPHIEKNIPKKIFRYFIMNLNNKIYKLSQKSKKIFLHIHSKKMLPRNWNENHIIFQQHPLVVTESNKDLFLLKENKIVFTFIGRLEYYKGLDLFIEVIKNLNDLLDEEVLKKICFVVAGRGNIEPIEIESQKVDIKIINKFLSEEEFDSIIVHSDVIVLPYIEATQSGVLAKAVYADKVAIVSDKGALSDYVIDNKTGFVIKPTVEELQSKIVYFIKSENEIMTFKKNTEEFKNSFSSNTIKKNMFSKIYND